MRTRLRCEAYHIFFKNLANGVKTDIISALKKKSMSVNELSKELDIEQSKLSHSLANLKFCNLVGSKQIGKKRIYSLNKKTILPILKIIDQHREKNCEGCKLKK
ncbi:winged helix-turn-helix transcriptional regulator [Candidatus Pacearchaeota archaeon]|nr:hypothetical protein [uncultured archaeon]MBS3084298.1 winged helix-turn-helix transcriptional regulator [Candidatus Pacearchaeota archaeon]